MPIDRSHIRVKAMLLALDDEASSHVVSLNPPTLEHPGGYHRLIGGGVELGETHRDAIVREVREELDANILDLRSVAAVENIFEIDGERGHEVVFLYSGRLDPPPARAGATRTESDGSIVPVVWRRVDDESESLPLFPLAAVSWLRHVAAAAHEPTGR